MATADAEQAIRLVIEPDWSAIHEPRPDDPIEMCLSAANKRGRDAAIGLLSSLLPGLPLADLSQTARVGHTTVQIAIAAGEDDLFHALQRLQRALKTPPRIDAECKCEQGDADCNCAEAVIDKIPYRQAECQGDEDKTENEELSVEKGRSAVLRTGILCGHRRLQGQSRQFASVNCSKLSLRSAIAL